MRSAVSFPPLPCPNTICRWSKIGKGHDPKTAEARVSVVGFSSFVAETSVAAIGLSPKPV
jgi:hypothetical protein